MMRHFFVMFASAMPPLHRFLPAVALLALIGETARAAGPSETDYFSELPEVLTVTRLAQPLADTPGAVTIIDRETIRRSGAREMTELLRLAPGFVLHHMSSGARPVASYHSAYSDILRHMQVMIDGRSVYSSLLVGTANNGLMGLVLEDIERIEILRGSNSASIGGNAFHGVVNVITRHAHDAQGAMMSMNLGEGGVADGTARFGWGDAQAAYRITVASRRDSGYKGLHDDKRIEQGHFRADWRPTLEDEIMFVAGFTRYGWGMQSEFPAAIPRNEIWDNGYVNVQWSRQLSATDALKFGAQIDTEEYKDFYPRFRADGTSRRTELEAHHSFALGNAWRIVWGGQYRHEQVVSPDLFFADQKKSLHLWRGFGNAEWKPNVHWTINLGGMLEEHSVAGRASAPRLMVNYHLLPGHTLRLGESTGYRQPTLFESHADWWHDGAQQFRASNGARAEKIKTVELGYLGDFQSLKLSIDARFYHEDVQGLMVYSRPCGTCPIDIVNRNNATQRGWETQWRWRPRSGTELWLNYAEIRLIPAANSATPQDRYRAPERVSSLAWFQQLPHDWDLTLIHYEVGSRFVVRLTDMIPKYRQTDMRLGKQFRLGATRAEAALTVRALGGGGVDYVERSMPTFHVGRRAHLTFKLEF